MQMEFWRGWRVMIMTAALGLAGCMELATPSATSTAKLTAASIQDYLAEAELARPETVKSVAFALRQGKTFRKRLLDQRNRWSLTTIWVDSRNVLHIRTKRNEPCPACNGTGKRQINAASAQNLPFNLRCLKCDGKSFLPNHVKERKYVLSSEDYMDRVAARQAVRKSAYNNAPPGALDQVRLLTSKSPTERLAACRWLDQNYIRNGEFFQNYLPMLRKARWREASEDKGLAVYQFWAGKGDPALADEAYYRVYVTTSNGRIKEKGFYPEEDSP